MVLNNLWPGSNGFSFWWHHPQKEWLYESCPTPIRPCQEVKQILMTENLHPLNYFIVFKINHKTDGVNTDFNLP